MELFEEIENTNIDEGVLKRLLTIEHLPELCNSINTVISNNKDSGVIYCVWGEHDINREILKHGVRFSLPKCPNALAWSITTKAQAGSNNTVIHCTTDTKENEDDFIESIREFVRDWRIGISSVSAISH